MAAAPAGVPGAIGGSMDEVERAVVCAFGPVQTAGGAGAGNEDAKRLQTQAAAFLDQLKAQPNAWGMAFQLFLKTARVEVRFWCLQVLDGFINSSDYEAVPLPRRVEVRAALMAWIQTNAGAAPPYLKNWLALVLVRFVRADYPEYWPTAFDEVFALAAGGPKLIDIILRFLQSVDELVVARTPTFNKAMHRRNTAIKDAMRRKVCGQLCSLIHTVVVTFKTSNEPLAEAALKTLEKYVSWIDIGLVANDTFVPLLCELLGNETLRIPALACFYEMVAKGMTRMEKVSLIGRLRLVELLCALRVDAGVDPEFLADVAELVSLVGVELVGAWQNCVEGAGEGAMPALVAPMLSSLAQRAFVLLVHPEVSVGKEVVTFAHAMVICIKKELAATEVPPSVVAASFSVRSFTKQLIECLASRMRYPTEALSKNDEAEFAEARRSVKSEFMNLTRACRNEIMEFFGAHIAPKVAMLASLAWQDCELAMHMLYHFAEAVPTTVMNEAMKAGPLCDMVVAIHKSGVGLHKHRLVVLAYMDLTVRYAGVLHAHPELLLPVLQGMMGAGGLKHQESQTRKLSAYHIFRLVRTFARAKTLAAPLVDPIIGGLREFLVVPYPNAPPVAGALPPENQSHLYETVGLLVAAPWMPPERTAALLQAALSPLIDQMNLGLSHAASGSMTAETATAMGDWMTRVLSVIGPVVKAFVTPVPDNVAAVIHVVLEVAVKAGQAVPHHEKLRQKVMFLLHVGIICLGDRLLPVLGPVIVGLVNTMGVPAVPDVGRLLHQLVAKFKAKAVPVIDVAYMPFVSRLFSLMPAPDHTPGSAISLERAELQQAYLSALNSILVHECSAAMVTPRNQEAFPTVLATICQAAADTFSPKVVRSAFSALRAMVHVWLPTSAPLVGADAAAAGIFLRFVWDTAAAACFNVCAAARFDFDDAAAGLAASEILSFLAMMMQRCTKPEAHFAQHLAASVLPSLGIPADTATEFCRQLSSCVEDPRRMKKAFTHLCLRLRELRSGAAAAKAGV